MQCPIHFLINLTGKERVGNNFQYAAHVKLKVATSTSSVCTLALLNERQRIWRLKDLKAMQSLPMVPFLQLPRRKGDGKKDVRVEIVKRKPSLRAITNGALKESEDLEDAVSQKTSSSRRSRSSNGSLRDGPNKTRPTDQSRYQFGPS